MNSTARNRLATNAKRERAEGRRSKSVKDS
jgi:hypothetical protein